MIRLALYSKERKKTSLGRSTTTQQRSSQARLVFEIFFGCVKVMPFMQQQQLRLTPTPRSAASHHKTLSR